ncbi:MULTISPECIES: UbiA family prenyltransferase [unclassified Streptomyces]|uniref:UbiA family prenyltransferase n=1 Tax=unclassified Streptomyces TaxID=2593676 RepID=UPI00339F758F
MLLQEPRIPVQVIFLLRFLSAVALASNLPAVLPTVLLTGAAWSLATIGVYVFNGVMDVAEDRVNGSSRPIASGALGIETAKTGVLLAIGLAFALGLAHGDGTLLFLLAVYVGCGYAYSGPPFHGKRRGSSAALLVLGFGVLTYAAGWESSEHLRPVPVLLLAAAMSLWMAGVGAFAKDLSDVAGDLAGGRRTPVIAWGETRTRLVVAADALAIGTLYLVAAAAWAPTLLPSAMAVEAGAVAVTVLVAVTRRSTVKAHRRLPCRAFMATQYAAHVAVFVMRAVR